MQIHPTTMSHYYQARSNSTTFNTTITQDYNSISIDSYVPGKPIFFQLNQLNQYLSRKNKNTAKY